MSLVIIIWLEAWPQPTIGFTLWWILALFTRSAITPPKVNWFGWNLEHSEFSVGGWPWEIFTSDSWWARQIFLSGMQLMITPRPIFTKFEHNTPISVVMKTFRTEFWKFYFKNFRKIFSVLWPGRHNSQWLQIAGNSLLK